MLALIFAMLALGSATGVQRTVLSVYSRGHAPTLLIALLPVLSFGLFKSIADLMGGVLADRAGRKLTLVTGAALYLAGASFLAFGDGVLGAAAGNVLIGAGEGVFYVSAMAALSDIMGSQKAARAIGCVEGFAYLGYGLGALVAGLLWGMISLDAPFVYAVISAAMALLILVAWVGETKPLMARERRFAFEEREYHLSTCLKRPGLVSAYTAAHLSKLADTLVWALVPLHFWSMGFSPLAIGVVASSYVIAWAASMPLWGLISDRVGRKPLVALGLLLTAPSLLILSQTRNLAAAVLLMAALGLCYGMQYPTLPAIVVDLVPLRAKAAALGLYRGFRDLGYFTGAIVLGLLAESWGTHAMFDLVAFVMALAAVPVVSLIRETRPAWPFFGLVLDHVAKIRECIEVHGDFLRSVFSGDVKRAELADRRIKALERAADGLKRVAMARIWSSPLPLWDRMEFEKLIEILDKAAGALLECDERLLRVRAEKLSEEIKEGFLEMHREILRTANVFVENLKALKISPVYALKLSDEVERAETKVDVIRRRLLAALRRELEEGRLDYLSAIDLRDAVDLMEMIADDLEDASDIVRIVAYKHFA